MLDLPHLGVTLAAALAVIGACAAILRTLDRSWRASTIRHELSLARCYVNAGQHGDARDAWARAWTLYRATIPLAAGDLELLELGPASLLPALLR